MKSTSLKTHHSKRFTIPCVIFAGGKSSRMKTDKALLPFGNYNSLAEFQYQRLSKLFANVYISAKEDKFDFDAPLILDTKSEEVSAPTAGFEAMFRQLKDEHIFVLSVDTPFVGEKEIHALLQNDTHIVDAVIARTESGSHPLCGIYHRSLQPVFEKMLKEDDHRLGKMLNNAKTKWVMFDDEAAFTNLNHPHEYQEACKKL